MITNVNVLDPLLCLTEEAGEAAVISHITTGFKLSVLNTQWFHQSVSLEEILTGRLQAAERRHRGVSSVSLLQLQFYQNWEMYFSEEEGWRPGTEGFSWWRTCPCVSLGFSISLNPSQASLLVALTCCSSYWLKFAFYESAALFQTVSTGSQ